MLRFNQSINGEGDQAVTADAARLSAGSAVTCFDSGPKINYTLSWAIPQKISVSPVDQLESIHQVLNVNKSNTRDKSMICERIDCRTGASERTRDQGVVDKLISSTISISEQNQRGLHLVKKEVNQ